MCERVWFVLENGWNKGLGWRDLEGEVGRGGVGFRFFFDFIYG